MMIVRDVAIKVAGIERQIDARMLSSVDQEPVCACNITGTKCGRLVRAALPRSRERLFRHRIGHTARSSTLPAMRMLCFMTADAGTNGMPSTGKLASV
jgi:hypothetical protein